MTEGVSGPGHPAGCPPSPHLRASGGWGRGGQRDPRTGPPGQTAPSPASRHPPISTNPLTWLPGAAGGPHCPPRHAAHALPTRVRACTCTQVCPLRPTRCPGCIHLGLNPETFPPPALHLPIQVGGYRLERDPGAWGSLGQCAPWGPAVRGPLPPAAAVDARCNERAPRPGRFLRTGSAGRSRGRQARCPPGRRQWAGPCRPSAPAARLSDKGGWLHPRSLEPEGQAPLL